MLKHTVFRRDASHVRAVLQALLVTFLWSTSWVFIKIGLAEIPTLTFAGLRYSLAFCCLLPFGLRATHLASFHRLSGWDWTRLVGLGLLFYTLTQGAQFLALSMLPAITVNLLLSFTPVVVSFLSIVWLKESASGHQWLGIGFYVLGVVLFFSPASLPTTQMIGLVVVVLGVLTNASATILGRYVNRRGDLAPLTITLVSMGSGACLLLLIGLMREGMPSLTWRNWAIVGWLALVNTAFAFTLWNHTMRMLSALESSLINNTMMIQIPLLALLFLGEVITWRAVFGMALAGTGILLVQLRR